MYTSQVPVEGKSSVCAISMKYMKMITIIIIISLGKILLSYIYGKHTTYTHTHTHTREHAHTNPPPSPSGCRCSMGQCAQL